MLESEIKKNTAAVEENTKVSNLLLKAIANLAILMSGGSTDKSTAKKTTTKKVVEEPEVEVEEPEEEDQALEGEEEELTMAIIKEATSLKMKAGLRDEAKAVINKFAKTKKLSGIDLADYRAFYDEIEAL